MLLAVLYVTQQPTTVALAGTLSCSVATSGACTTGVVIYRMSGASNAHAELASQANANYNSNVVCCTNVIGIGNSCAATTTAILTSMAGSTERSCDPGCVQKDAADRC